MVSHAQVPKSTENANKGFTLIEIMIVVVMIGLLTALAIPLFQKIQTSSQDKAVINNARQLAAAANQYFLEQGVTIVPQANLIGASCYIKVLNPVAAETYPASLIQGVPFTIVGIAGARTLTYSP